MARIYIIARMYNPALKLSPSCLNKMASSCGGIIIGINVSYFVMPIGRVHGSRGGGILVPLLNVLKFNGA